MIRIKLTTIDMGENKYHQLLIANTMYFFNTVSKQPKDAIARLVRGNLLARGICESLANDIDAFNAITDEIAVAVSNKQTLDIKEY